ncbi:MAG TPA: class II aldolase/adducin family protein [Anaerovoracaceae bacterium]|nr:class II aldolase/adducin family protein [Anaerovoracaceae bacterium]
MNKQIRIITGGTFFHVRPHLALAAPAFGAVGNDLQSLCKHLIPEMDTGVVFTRMADPMSGIETNQDVEALLDEWIQDLSVKIIFMPVALCDFEGHLVGKYNEQPLLPSGKKYPRLKTSEGTRMLHLRPAEKIISKIRKERKDIFLIGFKTTAGVSEQEMFSAGLNLCKTASCNLVLVNDIHTKMHMIVTPEEAAYHVTNDRLAALTGLVEMAKLRSHLTFTRSTIIAGDAVPWNSEIVPETLRKVVDFCVKQGAYKVFNGATVGHFAAKIDDTTFLTSKRKTNFNDIAVNGLVKIKTDGPDTVLAYGAKPSVGGQSQRIVFKDHPDCDCIVHFHCVKKSKSEVPTVSQREFECGSHQCGENTSRGLKKFGNLHAVYLDQHGPNIVFNRNIDPAEVISFIEQNFDLDTKSGGYTV